MPFIPEGDPLPLGRWPFPFPPPTPNEGDGGTGTGDLPTAEQHLTIHADKKTAWEAGTLSDAVLVPGATRIVLDQERAFRRSIERVLEVGGVPLIEDAEPRVYSLDERTLVLELSPAESALSGEVSGFGGGAAGSGANVGSDPGGTRGSGAQVLGQQAGWTSQNPPILVVGASGGTSYALPSGEVLVDDSTFVGTVLSPAIVASNKAVDAAKWWGGVQAGVTHDLNTFVSGVTGQPNNILPPRQTFKTGVGVMSASPVRGLTLASPSYEDGTLTDEEISAGRQVYGDAFVPLLALGELGVAVSPDDAVSLSLKVGLYGAGARGITRGVGRLDDLGRRGASSSEGLVPLDQIDEVETRWPPGTLGAAKNRVPTPRENPWGYAHPDLSIRAEFRHEFLSRSESIRPINPENAAELSDLYDLPGEGFDKVKSRTYQDADGNRFEYHWYEHPLLPGEKIRPKITWLDEGE